MPACIKKKWQAWLGFFPEKRYVLSIVPACAQLCHGKIAKHKAYFSAVCLECISK